ncbi:MAG: NfeD family protein [Phreatobacter sp.]|uniref:NfeD family protein n=1 Tax=Phreatobacter sp. TaxID=1966341 RepID=UPI002733D638|nr:NfeD family protein [Phreatobacter sp.]MDP2803313.1 NfeD family protein [Phreatobacter sp.]
MIVATLAPWGAWSWIAIAAVLMAAEILVPGYFLIWLGAAAALTGIIFIIVPSPWQIQLLVFAVLSLLCLFGWVKVMKSINGTTSDKPDLNRRLEAMIGKEFVLEEPIQAGRGRVRIADSVWLVTGPDLATGARVRVTDFQGAVLVVEAA